jgi:iron complex transport system substrate-binding protein
MGETCIPQNPQRVVALWTGTFRSTLALGIKPIATAWTPGEPLPKFLQGKVDGVESVGNLDQLNLEKILLLKPDLILSIPRLSLDNVYARLSNIAPTVVMDVSSPSPPWQKLLEDIANIFDKEQEKKQLVDELIDEYWQRIEQLKQALGDHRHQLQVSVAALHPGSGTIHIYGKKFPTGVVLNDIGLQRPPAQSGDFWVMNNISYERLSEIDSDVLFLSTRKEKAYEEALEKLQRSPLWQKLKAVQRNQVYFVDLDHWYAFDVLAMNAVIDDLFKYLVNTH